MVVLVVATIITVVTVMVAVVIVFTRAVVPCSVLVEGEHDEDDDDNDVIVQPAHGSTKKRYG